MEEIGVSLSALEPDWKANIGDIELHLNDVRSLGFSRSPIGYLNDKVIDALVYAYCRKYGVKVYQKDLLEQLVINNETPTRLDETLLSKFPASYLWHIKHSLKSTYTENELFTKWKTQNSELTFIDRTIKGITKALFFYDTTTQLPILTKYPQTILNSILLSTR
jgi:hypothetical protein